MAEMIDNVGQKFGRLTVVKREGIYCHCVCDCGNTAIVHCSSLRRGITKSCGCLRIEKNKERASTSNNKKERELNEMGMLSERQIKSIRKDAEKWLEYFEFLEDN